MPIFSESQRTYLEGFLPPPWDLLGEAWKPYYTGLPVQQHEIQAMIKTGFIDVGQVDPKIDIKPQATGNFIRILSRLLAAKKGIGYIRDPKNLLKKFPGNLPASIPAKLRQHLSDTYSEQADYEAEAENDAGMRKWQQAAKDIKKAKVTVKKVQGKTGAGYKVTMTPVPK